MENKSKELQTAIEAAKKGAAHAFGYYKQNLLHESKEDKTPVTRADKESEEVM